MCTYRFRVLLLLNCVLQLHSATQAAQPLTLGFIGAGMMASALITGITKAGQAPPSQITASDTYQVKSTSCIVSKLMQCSCVQAACKLQYCLLTYSMLFWHNPHLFAA
jgi:NADP oxidoreductase coenzyme F420-dependent